MSSNRIKLLTRQLRQAEAALRSARAQRIATTVDEAKDVFEDLYNMLHVDEAVGFGADSRNYVLTPLDRMDSVAYYTMGTPLRSDLSHPAVPRIKRELERSGIFERVPIQDGIAYYAPGVALATITAPRGRMEFSTYLAPTDVDAILDSLQ